MITSSKQFILFIAIALLTACNASNASAIEYETYFNEMNDYTVEYPSYLTPQNEESSEAGEKFISADGKTQLFIYSDYENVDLDGDNQQAMAQAYKQELKSTEGVFNKNLGDTHYIIESKKDDILHTVYVGFYDVTYFNFRFEYPEKDKKMMTDIVSHVVESLRIGVREGTLWPSGDGSVGEAEEMFTAFLEDFLNDSYFGKNFNTLLRNNDKALAAHIDPKMDVRRYYAPGTVAKLGSRSEDFGFAPEDDFVSKPTIDGEVIFELIASDADQCSLDFSNRNIIYYHWFDKVPDVVVNMETFATKPVSLAYPYAQLMAVYLPNPYGNPRGFYFINGPDGWKLAFIDDAQCGA